MSSEIDKKYNNLLKYLRNLDRVAIAFSGGVDSTFLVFAAQEALADNVIAYTVNSPYIPNWEVSEASEWIQQMGIEHAVISAGIPDNILNNPEDRCYLCKKQIFSMLIAEMEKQGIKYLLEGTNKDDEGEYRPGMRALEELKVLSPLREVGLTKSEIRQLSKSFNLPTWDKPSYACLLTRIPYDTLITHEELQRIEEGEVFLFDHGLKGARLRSHGTIARIELQQEQFKIIQDKEIKELIVDKLKSIGYLFVCVDLQGYRTGSYDGTIGKNK
jgi:uncharacterized protein